MVRLNKRNQWARKRHSKYFASFDYFDKSSIVLSATTGSISIASFAIVIEAPVRIASASFSLAFSNSPDFKEYQMIPSNWNHKENQVKYG